MILTKINYLCRRIKILNNNLYAFCDKKDYPGYKKGYPNNKNERFFTKNNEKKNDENKLKT
jgi:hypothetical protein